MTRSRFAAALLAAGVLSAAPAPADPIPPGPSMRTATIRGDAMDLHTYRPPGCPAPALLVVFHGSDRDAGAARDAARGFADRACLVVVAPHFDQARFPDWKYQFGGLVHERQIQPRDRWTVDLAADVVAWARTEEGDPGRPFFLYGHSAGGQYLSRVAAFAMPPGVGRAVVANPSVHLLASLRENVAYAMGGLPPEFDSVAMLRDYLAAPVTIYLGTEDNRQDEDLAMGPAAMRQGENRLERGEFAYLVAEDEAASRGWKAEFAWRFVYAAGVGHSSGAMLDAPEVFEAFGIAPVR